MPGRINRVFLQPRTRVSPLKNKGRILRCALIWNIIFILSTENQISPRLPLRFSGVVFGRPNP